MITVVIFIILFRQITLSSDIYSMFYQHIIIHVILHEIVIFVGMCVYKRTQILVQSFLCMFLQSMKTSRPILTIRLKSKIYIYVVTTN